MGKRVENTGGSRSVRFGEFIQNGFPTHEPVETGSMAAPKSALKSLKENAQVGDGAGAAVSAGGSRPAIKSALNSLEKNKNHETGAGAAAVPVNNACSTTGAAVKSVLRSLEESARIGVAASAPVGSGSGSSASAVNVKSLVKSLEEDVQSGVRARVIPSNASSTALSFRAARTFPDVKPMLLKDPATCRLSVALLPRDSAQEGKTGLVQRLRAMNDQMTAMDEMSRNIESEFHHSKMILDTLQVMNDSYQPGQSGYTEQVTQVQSRQTRQTRQEVDPNRRSAESPLPRISEGSPVPSARVSARSTKSARSPSPTLHSKRSDVSPRNEASRASNLSGMSDISDIIGEVLAEGGVDLQAAGMTQEEADMYAARAKEKHRPTSPMSSYKELQTIVTDAEEQEAAKRSPEVHRRKIHQWMSEKYTERQNEYNRQRLTLKEKEHHPYRPSTQVHMGTRDLKTLEEEREQRRQDRQRQDMERRLMEAEYLIGSAITEAKETKHEISLSRSRSLSPPRSRSRSRSTSPPKPALTRSVSPRRREARSSAAVTSQPVSRPTQREVGRAATSALDQTFSISAPPKGILKASRPVSGPSSQPILVQPAGGSSDFEVTGGSSADLRDYMSAIQNMDSSEDLDQQIRQDVRQRTRRPEPVPEKPAKAYKPKPFTEMVRLQRPQVTRRQESQGSPEEKYVQQVRAERAAAARKSAESARSKSSAASDRLSAQRSKAEERIRKAYAPMALPQPTTPRRVKTYTERLQELKPKHRYASPIIPRQHIPESASTMRSVASAPTMQRKPTGPAHKPMTYVEQLKQVNKAAGVQSRTGRQGGGSTAVPKTRMPARPAPHRPKTYTEQLQELNAPFKRTFRSTARGPPSFSSSRARPYGDPYTEDGHSVLSDWSMDDNVRKLLYDDDDTYDRYTVDGTEVSVDHLVFPPSEAGASDYYEAVMGGSDHYPDAGGMDYRDSVDVSELERIAEVASVGSGSVLSVIDWDAVDKLIEDV